MFMSLQIQMLSYRIGKYINTMTISCVNKEKTEMWLNEIKWFNKIKNLKVLENPIFSN